MKEFFVLLVGGSSPIHVIVKGLFTEVENNGILKVFNADSMPPIAQFPSGSWSAVIETTSLIANKQQESV